jgi:hypothetical protein
MYFLLHHPTGTLMLEAQDLGAAISWSKRQLGQGSSRAAIVEVDQDASTDWVEKSGTGIRESNCEAFLSIMADSIQRVSGSNHNDTSFENRFRVSDSRSLVAVVH